MADTQREFAGNSMDIDFSEGLGEQFGVEDTTTIGKNQLDSWLFNQPSQVDDASKITKVEENEPETGQNTPRPKTNQKPKQETQQTKTVEPEEEDELEKANDSLQSWLTKDDEDQDDQKGQEQPKEKEKEKKPEANTEEENQFVTLSRDLYKLGVFTKEDEEDETLADSGEAFLERFQAEKKKGAAEMIDNFLERFGDEYRDMFDSVFVKGVNPKDYLASFDKLSSVKGLDLTSEANQEKIYKEYYRSQGLSEEKITKRLEKAKDYGDLADEAADLHELLVQKEEQNMATLEENKKKDLQAKQEREVAYQQNVNKILSTKLQTGEFDGIPVSKKDAQDTFYYMTNKPYKLPSGELITEMQKDWLELDKPENHELKVKVALLLKNKMDLSKVQKKAVSTKTDSLFTSITNKKTAQGRKEGTVSAPKSFFS